MPAEAVMSGLLEAWPPKCAYVVAEILQTEEAYVNALEDILEVRGWAWQEVWVGCIAL